MPSVAGQQRPTEPSATLTDWLASDKANHSLYPPLSPAERQAAFEWTCKYGPGNCWTGESGAMAIAIRSLLLELAEREAKEGAAL